MERVEFGCFERLTLSSAFIYINLCILTFVFLHFSAAGLSGVLLMPFAASLVLLSLRWRSKQIYLESIKGSG